jgi:hypothetical protein
VLVNAFSALPRPTTVHDECHNRANCSDQDRDREKQNREKKGRDAEAL